MPVTHLPVELKLYKKTKDKGPFLPVEVESWESERLAKAEDGTDPLYHALCIAFRHKSFAEKVDPDAEFYITVEPWYPARTD